MFFVELETGSSADYSLGTASPSTQGSDWEQAMSPWKHRLEDGEGQWASKLPSSGHVDLVVQMYQ